MASRDCSSSWFSWWSVALLFWGSYIIEGAANSTNKSSNGESITIHDCGKNTQNCAWYCETCNGFDQMWCLSVLIEEMCYKTFKIKMDLHNSTDWCVWSNVRGAYNNFTICTEEMAECLLIPWPNPMVENMFLNIHSTYFRNCPTEELSDPPPGIVLALVMTPISLLPVMVVLVVLKTKNGDGSS
ncbi:unnamed protein product [Lota lota]